MIKRFHGYSPMYEYLMPIFLGEYKHTGPLFLRLYSTCYLSILSLLLIKDRGKVLVKVSQSKPAKCNTKQINAASSRSITLCLLDYVKTVSNDFSFWEIDEVQLSSH